MSSVDGPFHGESRQNSCWVYAGTASSFPDIAPTAASNGGNDAKIKLTTSIPCAVGQSDSIAPESSDTSTGSRSACKVFRIPRRTAVSQEHEHEHDTAALEELSTDTALATVGLEDQLLIFRHRDKFHAVDHKCPHRSYPLSRGSVYDIEDFGIVLSAGIVCPKHSWAFDLFTGESDRGAYQLNVWDVKLDDDGGVWVRRR